MYDSASAQAKGEEDPGSSGDTSDSVMIQEKVNSTRQAGVTNIKTINAVEKDNFMHVFNFPEDVYDSAWAQATGEEDPGSSGDTSN